MIGITGAKLAPVILSLNASFIYLGFAFGAELGFITLTQGNLSDLGWVGALCERHKRDRLEPTGSELFVDEGVAQSRLAEMGSDAALTP